jgi:D-arabinose 1-dehydrogenase-like Zn-dependent alcohol dehydrogenase
LVTGITSDGGYADYMIARAETWARVPVDFVDRRCGALDARWHHNLQRPAQQRRAARRDGRGNRPWRARSSRVQFATKLGFRTVAIARGQDKVPLAHELGAHHYIDNAAEVIGAVESVTIDARALLRGRRSIKGWYSGTSIDSQETLAFSALTGVRPMTEIIPLERAAEGYERMMSGKARFRVVLTTES